MRPDVGFGLPNLATPLRTVYSLAPIRVTALGPYAPDARIVKI
jgi:hypothetical protein